MTAGEGGGFLFNSFLPLLPTSQTLTSWLIPSFVKKNLSKFMFSKHLIIYSCYLVGMILFLVTIIADSIHTSTWNYGIRRRRHKGEFRKFHIRKENEGCSGLTFYHIWRCNIEKVPEQLIKKLPFSIINTILKWK